jgi:hypothetical protein
VSKDKTPDVLLRFWVEPDPIAGHAVVVEETGSGERFRLPLPAQGAVLPNRLSAAVAKEYRTDILSYTRWLLLGEYDLGNTVVSLRPFGPGEDGDDPDSGGDQPRDQPPTTDAPTDGAPLTHNALNCLLCAAPEGR